MLIFIKNKNLHKNVDISGLNTILSSPLCFTIFAKCSTKDVVLLLQSEKKMWQLSKFINCLKLVSQDKIV